MSTTAEFGFDYFFFFLATWNIRGQRQKATAAATAATTDATAAPAAAAAAPAAAAASTAKTATKSGPGIVPAVRPTVRAGACSSRLLLVCLLVSLGVFLCLSALYSDLLRFRCTVVLLRLRCSFFSEELPFRSCSGVVPAASPTCFAALSRFRRLFRVYRPLFFPCLPVALCLFVWRRACPPQPRRLCQHQRRPWLTSTRSATCNSVPSVGRCCGDFSFRSSSGTS